MTGPESQSPSPGDSTWTGAASLQRTEPRHAWPVAPCNSEGEGCNNPCFIKVKVQQPSCPCNIMFYWRIHHLSFLVGGWTNPFEKYESNWKSSLKNRDEQIFFVWNHHRAMNYVHMCIPKYTTWKVDGATPMYWLIILSATFWELRHLLSPRCIYLEPQWPLFLKVNPPKQGPFQSKRVIFRFPVCIYIHKWKTGILIDMRGLKKCPDVSGVYNSLWRE